MNILELLEKHQWADDEIICPECRCCKLHDLEPDEHLTDCAWKSAIDALKSGRLVVVDKSIDDNRRTPKGFQRIEAYTDFKTVVIMGDPYLLDGDNHNCDAMGCGSTGHVMARLPIIKEKEQVG